MAKLIWTEEALCWLKDIGEYLSNHSPQAALKVTQGIFDKAQILIDHPEIGSRFLDSDGRNLRELIYGHYRIIYEISTKDSEHVVYVLVVFHGSMDIDRLTF